MAKKYFNNMPTTDRSAMKSSQTGFTQSRLLNLYNKIYNGASITGDNISLSSDVQINFAVNGDSVAGYKGYPIKEMLIGTFGKRGDFFVNTPTVTGDAYYHNDTDDCKYWFNGRWSGIINGNGTITYNYSGGSINGDRIRVYYVKKSGFGSFKVQESTTGFGGTYSDISGYTDIDCDSSSVSGEAGVLDISVADTKHNVRIVGLTGEVVIIAVSCQYIDGAGTMYWNMSAGGLSWENAINCPETILTPVFADLELDLMTFEAKEGDGTAIENYVYPFLNIVNNAWTKTDMLLIGSSPQSVNDMDNVSSNNALKTYADSNNKLYFDGYTPLVNYERMVELGWEGDGVHLDKITAFYLSNILIKDMGLDVIFYRNIYNNILNESVSTETLNVLKNGASVCSIQPDAFALDMVFKANRGFVFMEDDGSTKGVSIDKDGNIDVNGVYKTGGTSGKSGSFTTTDGKTITITNGIVTSIA